MNRFRISFFLLLSVTLPSYGQLTQEQKVSDFMQLSGLYAYAEDLPSPRFRTHGNSRFRQPHKT